MCRPLPPQLLADCHLLGRWPETTLLLHRNSGVPWMILVPDTDMADLLDLPQARLLPLLSQAADVAALIRRRWSLTKINVAALGNVVPQLHLHVIGRSPEDPCWPRPVWGQLPDSAGYSTGEVAAIRRAAAESFAEFAAASSPE